MLGLLLILPLYPFPFIVYFVIFPSLGGHLSPYWSFGATMNIGSIGAIGATSVIGATSANPYMLGATLSATNNLHQLVVVGK